MENCESFANRDCTAQFSELFSSNLFKILSKEGKIFFETSFEANGTCISCGIEKGSKLTSMVNYISETSYPELLINECY